MPKRYALLIKRRKAPHFLRRLSSTFLKKGGEKIKKDSQKPHKSRLKDSESLLLRKGEDKSEKLIYFAGKDKEL